MTKIQQCLALALAVTFQTISAAPAEPLLLFQLEKIETICIGAAKVKSNSKCDHFVDTKSVGKDIRQLLQRSQELFPVFSQPVGAGNYLVLLARLPSKSPQSTGYCGAGYEDHLVLLEHSDQKIVLRDDFLLQSCLKSISLDSDGNDDVLKAISVKPAQHAIEFRWLTNPDDQDHTLTISNGKFSLDQGGNR